MKKKETEIIENSISSLVKVFPVDTANARIMLTKACEGGEVESIVQADIDDWVNNRLKPNTVMLDKSAYTEMCVDALKILSGTAPTDFGGSRQRDLGQLWADMIRGYLGEFAFKLFAQKWNINLKLGHERGSPEKFLSSDIKEVCDANGVWRKPRIDVGVKTTKINGIWLDIPGDQFSHSDVHAHVKVAAGRDHLFRYLKELSVFKDKILPTGIESGSITKDEASTLFDELPDFRPIPAYICGFVKKSDLYKPLDYEGKKGIKHFKITGWKGPFAGKDDLKKIKKIEKIDGDAKFQGIQSFSNVKRHLFNSGTILWDRKDWDWVFQNL